MVNYDVVSEVKITTAAIEDPDATTTTTAAATDGGDESVLYGDANDDGTVNVADAVAILQYIANQEKYPLKSAANADCDGEAGITGNDAVTVQKIDAKILTQDEVNALNAK